MIFHFHFVQPTASLVYGGFIEIGTLGHHIREPLLGGMVEDRGRGAELVTRTTVSGPKHRQLSPEPRRGVVRLQLGSSAGSWLLHSWRVVVE